MARITGTFHADHYTFLIISHSLLRRMRDASDIGCREYQNIYIMLNKIFPKTMPFIRLCGKI